MRKKFSGIAVVDVPSQFKRLPLRTEDSCVCVRNVDHDECVTNVAGIETQTDLVIGEIDVIRWVARLNLQVVPVPQVRTQITHMVFERDFLIHVCLPPQSCGLLASLAGLSNDAQKLHCNL